MAKQMNIKSWDDVLSVVGELDLDMQVQFARLKGVELPQEVQDKLKALEEAKAAAKAQEEVRSGIKLVYGSQRDPSRVFLAAPGTEITPPGDKGKAATAQGPYQEVRSLDATIAFLTAARDVLKASGFNTGKAERPGGLTMEQARAAGFKATDGTSGGRQ